MGPILHMGKLGLRNLPGVKELRKGRSQLQPSFPTVPRAHPLALSHGSSLLALGLR